MRRERDVVAAATPWRSLWDARLRRTAGMLLAGLVFTVGFHLAFMETISWANIAVQAAVLELIIVMAGDPNGPVPSEATLQWMRSIGLRLIAYGAVAAAAAVALLVQFTPPVAAPLLVALFVPFTLGSLAFVVGGSLVYWSSGRLRRWNRTYTPQPRLMAAIFGAVSLAAAYAVIARAQQAGHWDPQRLAGFALVLAGCGLSVISSPQWMRDGGS